MQQTHAASREHGQRHPYICSIGTTPGTVCLEWDKCVWDGCVRSGMGVLETGWVCLSCVRVQVLYACSRDLGTHVCFLALQQRKPRPRLPPVGVHSLSMLPIEPEVRTHAPSTNMRACAHMRRTPKAHTPP